MNTLPYQVDREIIVKRDFQTNPDLGQNPEERPAEELINFGVINLNKPKGPTSHLTAEYVKKILKIKKAGHGGSLDPAVTGVLPIALDRATRIMDTFLKAGKEYVGIMHLHKDVKESEIKAAVKEFIGKITQIPPVKSAVVRQKRERNVYYFNILEINGKDILFRIGCQAGTYIRKICLHPQTEIITKDSLIPVRDFFADPKHIYSLENKKIRQKKPSEVQRFNFKGKLIRIIMSSGIEFSVTPEHKMLVSSKNGYVMKEASHLKNSDYIVKSLKYPVPEIKFTISDLLDEHFLVDQSEIKQFVKKAFIKKYGSIRAMNRNLKLDRKAFLEKSETAIPISHIKKAGIYNKIKDKIINFKTEKGIKIHFPELNNDLFYIMGLIAADGNNTKEKGTKRFTRIKFHNKNKELISLFLKKYKKLFPNFNISQKKFTENVIELDTSNSFLAIICSNFGIKSPQKNSDLFPILLLDKNLIAVFLRGYFDGDGSVYYKKKTKTKGTYTKIDFFTSNKTNAKRIHQMLLKIDISNKIFKVKEKYIVSINDKKRFISIIGSDHPFKKERLKLIKKMNLDKTKDNLYIAFHYKNYLKRNKSKLYKLGGNLYRIINSKTPLTIGTYLKACSLAKLPSLDSLGIEKIKKIKKTDFKGKVYDMTIPKTHNFLIETGFVSSNCHDLGKRLKCGAHMSELIRTKAGCFTDKDWVSLQDLEDAFYFYKNENNDKYLRFCIKPIEYATGHLPKIWVQDSAVPTICHGADLKIPGITKLESKINKQDTVAIMSEKDELIAIGPAMMTSEEIQDSDKGIAVKTEKVFMKENLYKQ